MTENNAAQAAKNETAVEILEGLLSLSKKEQTRGVKISREELRSLLSKLRAEGVQAGDERESFSDWAWRKDGLAIGHMDGQAAAWEAWQERARRAALASAPVAGEARPMDWQNAQRVAELPEVDEALANFCDDSTLDNAVGLVLAVLGAAPQASEAVRNALWTLTEHNALHFGERHNTVIQGRAALKADNDGGDCAKCAGVPSEPLRVFSAGIWTYDGTGQAFSHTDLDAAAFVTYRDALSPTQSVVKQSLTATQTGEKGESDEA